MRTISFEKLLQKSIKRTTTILFKPFNIKKWFLLLFIAYMAGAMGGGGNSGGGGSSSSTTKESEAYAQEATLSDESFKPGSFVVQDFGTGEILEDTDASGMPGEDTDLEPKEIWNNIKKYVSTPLGLTLAIVISLTAIAVFLVFTWIGARFRFIWFDAVTKNDASIKAPFIKYASQGDSLFGFFVILGCATVSLLGLLAWWGYASLSATGIMSGGEPSVWAMIGAIVPVVLIFFLVLILMAVIAFFVDHFVVTIMALEGCGFKTAWKKFTTLLKENTKEFTLATLLVLGLSIATSIALVLVMWILILVGLLVGGLIFGLLYLIFVALMKLQIVFAIIAVILGVPLAIAAILVLMSLALPIATFFRCFTLYFLSSLNCGYTPLALEEGDPGATPAPAAPA